MRYATPALTIALMALIALCTGLGAFPWYMGAVCLLACIYLLWALARDAEAERALNEMWDGSEIIGDE